MEAGAGEEETAEKQKEILKCDGEVHFLEHGDLRSAHTSKFVTQDHLNIYSVCISIMFQTSC